MNGKYEKFLKKEKIGIYVPKINCKRSQSIDIVVNNNEKQIPIPKIQFFWKIAKRQKNSARKFPVPGNPKLANMAKLKKNPNNGKIKINPPKRFIYIVFECSYKKPINPKSNKFINACKKKKYKAPCIPIAVNVKKLNKAIFIWPNEV